MATARRLSVVFLVAVLVGTSWFADVAYGVGTPGTIAISKTLLSDAINGKVISTLEVKTAVNVVCRRLGPVVYDDPWWLLVTVPSLRYNSGWVPDYDVNCVGTIGNCQVPSC